MVRPIRRAQGPQAHHRNLKKDLGQLRFAKNGYYPGGIYVLRLLKDMR